MRCFYLGIAAGMAMTVPGCALLVSLDDLSSKPTAAGDGGPDVAIDDGTPPDVHVDAAAGCASSSAAPFFCADFDEVQGLSIGFQFGTPVSIVPPSLGGGGSSALDPQGSSPPWAFLSSVPSLLSGAQAKSQYAYPAQLSNPTGNVRLEFDMRVDALQTTSPNGTIGIAEVLIKDAIGNGITASYYIESGGSAVLDIFNGSSDYSYSSTTIPVAGLSSYVHVALALQRTSSPKSTLDVGAIHTEATVGGAPVFTQAVWSSFYLGLSAVGPSAAAQVAFDNVVFETVP